MKIGFEVGNVNFRAVTQTVVEFQRKPVSNSHCGRQARIPNMQWKVSAWMSNIEQGISNNEEGKRARCGR